MADLFSDLNWFAVVAHVGKYQTAAAELERQRYRVFAPMCRLVLSHAGKKEIVQRSLFDRYLFVGIDFDQPFHPILSTRGVAFVVRGMGGIPCNVPRSALRAIKGRCDADGGAVNFVRPQDEPRAGKRPAPDWLIGTPLRITDGPFRDFLAVFEGATNGTARLVLQLFGREMPAEIDVDFLEPATAA